MLKTKNKKTPTAKRSVAATRKSTKVEAKQTLIFIHGFRGNHLGLEDLAKNYFNPRKYTVLIPDIPPAGNNTLKSFSAMHYSRFIAKYIKKNKLEKPILIGHSMGSIVAAAVAERYPELISDKIIFLAPISKKPSKFFSLISPLSVLLPNRLVTYITTRFVFIPKDKSLFKQILKTSYLCGKDYTSRKDVLKAASFSSSCAINDFEFQKTALFLSGDKDRLVPHRSTDAVAQKFKATNIYIKDSGHLLNYEKPEETAAAIKKFLKN